MKFKLLSYYEFQHTQKRPLKDFSEILTCVPKIINVIKFV